MVFDALLGRNGFHVGFLWRLIGAGLVAAFVLLAQESATFRQAIYQIDTSVIDRWQRLSGPDDPSGEVVVVGIDAVSIREIGRWPWGRQDLAELVNAIADANPKSVSLDILLSEPGVYSQGRLFNVFKHNVAEAQALLQIDPDAELVAALARVPSALAVAGGVRGDIDPDADNSNCMNPAVVNSDTMEAYFIECLLYPQSMYWDVAQDAVAAADHDLDGIVRRSRALVGQQLIDPNTGDALELFTAAFPVATLIACAGN
ncbi:MAG: CHASE2 domain-containing protein, partial [Paracoccaceae bacterium]|nr:CHASE2 domain-containing protein [Paracoccaceae bacterium]